MERVHFSQFLEVMDHEFRTVEIDHNKTGYRVDKVGIKRHCGYPQLKSVDYFHEKDERLFLVEFSDLASQHISILERIDQLKASNLDKKQRSVFIKSLHREISSEMRDKYLQSLTILNKMSDCIDELPDWALVNKGRLVIIVAPVSDDINDEQKTDIVRVLEKLKDDLTCSIPDDLFLSVKILPVHNFLA